MKAKKYIIMVVAFVISLIILTSCEQRQSKDYRLAEEFKSLGLKGDLKVIDTTKEIWNSS